MALISRYYSPKVAMPPLHISRTRPGIWIMATFCPVTPQRLNTDETNKRFIARWNNKTAKRSISTEYYIVTCNIPTHLLPGIRKKIKLTKAKLNFFLLNKDADLKVVFKFLEAQLLVNRIRTNPANPLEHDTTLQAGSSQNISWRE
jgi:hypothetical protein